jgi:nucleotide-binding universal stress UspA family protein
MYKNILVATDGSKLSMKAVDHALELAGAVGAKVTAFYAAPDYPMPAYADGVVYEPVSKKEYAKLAEEDATKILDAVTAKAKSAKVELREDVHDRLRALGGDHRRREEEQVRRDCHGVARPARHHCGAARQRNTEGAHAYQAAGDRRSLTGSCPLPNRGRPRGALGVFAPCARAFRRHDRPARRRHDKIPLFRHGPPMRVSRFYLSTLKEAPAEAEVTSQKLMLRSGMIKKLGAGIYTWMPIGLLTLRKVEAIVREEMNRAGALEVVMPCVQPAELWKESGRWDAFGPQMLRIKDRHERDFLFGPTHEEVITDIVRKEIRSYRQLPVNFYQMQVKFRDEIRPRFGVMRAREFIMKDAYSFDIDVEGMKKSYRAMYDAYARIFSRMGLKFRAVAADTGAIGGSASHEFQVLAESGEDAIAWSPQSDYAANVELAEALAPRAGAPRRPKRCRRCPRRAWRRARRSPKLLGLPLSRTVKCIMLASEDAGAPPRVHMLLIRGDHTLNEIKVTKIPGLERFRWATEAEIVAAVGCPPGYIGRSASPRIYR